MKKKLGVKKRGLALAMAVVLLGLTGCGQQKEANETPAPSEQEALEETTEPEEEAYVPSNNGEPMEIHVGDFPGLAYLYHIKLADHLGMFEEEFAKDNITVCIDHLGGGPVMNEALASGDLDMSFLGGQPTFSGMANGNGVKIITMATASSKDPCLLVAADSDITEISQLKGKNLSTEVGSDNHYQLVEMLALGGLVEDDINLYNLKPNEALPALLNGEIDCMQSVSPRKWQFINDGDVRILVNMSETTGRNNQVLVATEDFIENHGDLIVRFLKVLQRAVDYYKENKEECWDILSEYSSISRELMDDFMDDYDSTLGLTDTDKEYMENVYEFLYSHGMLDTEIDLENIYDDSFLLEAFGTVDCH